MKSLDLRITLLFLIALISTNGYSQQGGRGTMRGVVRDRTTSEPLIGANVAVKGLPKGASTNANGEFEITVAPGTYVLVVSYISYNRTETEKITVEAGKSVALTLALEPEAKKLADVVVRSKRKANTELAMITSLKSSALVVSGVSSQQIAKTQDRDASEVVRRIPGISVVDGKFIVIRGLAQRYNNVWMNGAAVPSSEADSRAFSFDMIPSSQLDNITVVKSPAPELPADFSGGFVQISTKDATESNSAELSFGAGINDQTQFKGFRMAPTGKFDLLGFDGGTRALGSRVPFRLNNDLASNSAQINDVTRTGFNNDWGISSHKSFSRPEQRLSLMLNRKINVGEDRSINLSLAANYSNTYKALHNMENALIGSYDIVNDRPNYFFRYTDNQYNAESKVGAMLNLSYALSSKSSLQLRNVVNQQGRNRLTERVGDQLNSGYYQEKQEFLYSSRLTYSGQLSGNHNLDEKGKLDWSLGYSLSNKNQPDRRTISRDRNINNPNDPLEIDFNDTKRLFVDLNENVYSGAANYQYRITRFGSILPTLKVGLYGEYKNRDYDTRSFYYILNETPANSALKYQSNEEVFSASNLGTNGLYAYEDTRNTDSYKADNTLGAGYLGISIPISKLNIYGGVRFENNKMSLTKYVSMDPTDFSTKKTSYTQSDLFPSLNTTYSISSKQLVRLAYGATVNRPEFRELSPSTYYDFELFSFVKGNEDLKTSYIQNIDLRYELYPSQGEMMTVALFYKNFTDPIESTYFENAGGYTYSYTNAKSATNIGAEVDMKKDLGFVGLKSFSLSVNAAYIHSRVKFDAGNTLEHSRPMQGQSPYLINTGLFYQNDRYKLTCGLLYNVIGERIVGVGRRVAGNPNISVPDIYERPRNLVDLTFNVALSKYITLSGAAKNLLNEDVVLEQQAKFTDASGASQTRNQTKQRYNPGRSYSLSLGIKL